MLFLAPLGLLLAALAIPILLLYMLKLRRRPVQVSSILLWMKLLRDRQANAPWQKLRRNLLLLLQLLILACLVLAFARPALELPAVASGAVIVLLDGSASMQAADVEPTRFEAARRSVRTLVSQLPGGSRMTLILVGRTPEILSAAEPDRSRLLQALNAAEPGQGGADWQAALAVAAGAAQASPEATTVIVSDGGLPETGLPAMPGEVRFVPIGESGGNLAVTALALRAARGGPELFARVTNYSDETRTVLLSIYLGDRLLAASQLEVAAGADRTYSLQDLPDAPGIYRAQISNPEDQAVLDALALDDAAYAVYQASSSRRVLLVSRGNLFLEQLLASLPAIQAFRALPGEDGNPLIPNEPFDLYVLDGIVPAPLPPGNLLMVQPSTNQLFEVGGHFSETGAVRIRDDPRTRHVDWSGVHVLQADSIQPPVWMEVLIEAEGGPLVLAGETNLRRVAAVTFDLRQSDLPLQVAFPILFSNLIDYLIPPSALDAVQPLQPGAALRITPPPGTEEVVVVSPSGHASSLPASQGSHTFTETGELGYYAVNFISGDSVSAEYFAVDLFDPAESDIRPRPIVWLGRAPISADAAEQVGLRELWQWLAGSALAVLLIEWQVYHRRQIPAGLRAGT